MTQSKEFPQYAWIPARSWTPGRLAGQPSVIFMHTTEGSEGTTSAEADALYGQTRTDGTSTHFSVDQDTTVQCVLTTDEAHTARRHGNDVGVHIENCGRAGQTAAQWDDEASRGTIEQAARLCVALRAERPGNYPLVNLTPEQLRAKQHGFAEHLDATLAWPEDGGTHSDPGPNYPWAKLFARIRQIEWEEQVIDMGYTLDQIANAVVEKLMDRLVNIEVRSGQPANMQPIEGLFRYESSEHHKAIDNAAAATDAALAAGAGVAELGAQLMAMREDLATLVAAHADPSA